MSQNQNPTTFRPKSNKDGETVLGGMAIVLVGSCVGCASAPAGLLCTTVAAAALAGFGNTRFSKWVGGVVCGLAVLVAVASGNVVYAAPGLGLLGFAAWRNRWLDREPQAPVDLPAGGRLPPPADDDLLLDPDLVASDERLRSPATIPPPVPSARVAPPVPSARVAPPAPPPTTGMQPATLLKARDVSLLRAAGNYAAVEAVGVVGQDGEQLSVDYLVSLGLSVTDAVEAYKTLGGTVDDFTADQVLRTAKGSMLQQLGRGLALGCAGLTVVGCLGGMMYLAGSWWYRDTDNDGVTDRVDCKLDDPQIATAEDEDQDCDGLIDIDDCELMDPSNRRSKKEDGDCDGVANARDCDPNGHVDDLDCDGVATEVDCDDANKVIATAKSADQDCDGIVDTEDCKISDSAIATRTAEDQDCDGMTDERDCAPTSAVIKYDKSVVGDCRGPLVDEGMIAQAAPSVPDRFEDSNPLSGLVNPNAAADSTTMSGADRQALASKATSTLWVSKTNCATEFNQTLKKVMVDCGEQFHTGFYVTALPVTRRSQECGPGSSYSCGACSSNADCEPGFFVGCFQGFPGSKCVWGRCTARYEAGTCDDPKFTDAAVPSWTFSANAVGSDGDFITQHSWPSGGVRVAFRIVKATRQVFTKRNSDGETIVEHDSGYRVKVNPIYAAYTNGTRWITLLGGANLAGTFDVQGVSYKVVCTADTCTVTP